MADNNIKPYGDRLNDGYVQLSFTLPVENGARARKAAEEYVAKLNFEDINIAHAKKIADNFTFFIIYARAIPVIDYSTVKAAEIESKKMTFDEINALIREKLKRKITVVGATIGNDAHTLGIDAIMNMKGYNHDFGLERYPEINACNLGAQVEIDDLIHRAVSVNADAILVSQTVTQRDSHKENCSRLIDRLKEKNLRERFLMIVGGPRITHDTALELGFDAGFGPDTLPSHVASFIVFKLIVKEVKK